jgi:hypothetical protein
MNMKAHPANVAPSRALRVEACKELAPEYQQTGRN